MEGEKLRDIYNNLPGEGVREDDRTDSYLKSNNITIGIKIREGKHEIKVKTAPDQMIEIGTIEDWGKWSNVAEKKIVNTVKKSYGSDWVDIVKTRWKKKYDLDSRDGAIQYTKKMPVDGCGAEFTELVIGGKEKWYTFGLEAFGNFKHCKKNLLETIRFLELEKIDFSEFKCLSYPEFIKNVRL